MLKAISQLFVEQTWILISSSTKTTRNGVILLLCFEFKNWGMLSAMVYIRVNITDILHGVTKQILKLTYSNLKTKQGKPCSHFFKCSNYKGDHQADSNLCSF